MIRAIIVDDEPLMVRKFVRLAKNISDLDVVGRFTDAESAIAFSRDKILENVWEENYYGSDRVVDDTLRRLRKKLPNLNIHTIHGYGYRLG